MNEREFWLMVRQGLLMIIDAIERVKVGIEPRTAELRKILKSQQQEEGDQCEGSDRL